MLLGLQIHRVDQNAVGRSPPQYRVEDGDHARPVLDLLIA